MNRYDLTDFEWSVIEPLLPNKPRGVPRVDDRRVLNGIMWVLRSGAPWRDLPERYGPYTTCYNRFNRWRKNGVWDRLSPPGPASSIETTAMRRDQDSCLQRPFAPHQHEVSCGKLHTLPRWRPDRRQDGPRLCARGRSLRLLPSQRTSHPRVLRRRAKRRHRSRT